MSMKVKPILFSGEMVRAILEGRKTQTRRVVKPQPDSRHCMIDFEDGLLKESSLVAGCWDVWEKTKCPFGNPGDLVYVRETWADVNSYEGPSILYKADSDIVTWNSFCIEKGEDYGAGPSMNYDKYPGEYVMWWEDLLDGEPDHKWKPSIHMPRWVSRLTLKITSIRVERLQGICEDDAAAEGPPRFDSAGDLYYSAKDAFWGLWESINGKPRKGGTDISWNANPWVWVISFEPILKNVDVVLEDAK